MSSQQRRCVCVNVEYSPGGSIMSAAFSRLLRSKHHMSCRVLPNHTHRANRCNNLLFFLLNVLSLLTAFHTSFAYSFSSCYFTLPETLSAASLLLPNPFFRLGPQTPNCRSSSSLALVAACFPSHASYLAPLLHLFLSSLSAF